MPKFNIPRIKQLIDELSQDPKIKAALDKINDKSQIGQHVKQLKDFLPLLGKLSRFGGKRTLAVAQTLTLIVVLFEVSVLIKQNVFDRPEVRKFFMENWGVLQRRVGAIYMFVNTYVQTQLKRRQDKNPPPPQETNN